MIVNDIGYSFLNAIHPRTIEAIEVFKLNTQNYTKSWNCFDSLAEAYKINGDTKNAITNYERAIKRVPKGDKVNINRIKSYIKELKKTKKLTSRIKRSNSKTI
jgi:predicted Zn-dependent protease